MTAIKVAVTPRGIAIVAVGPANEPPVLLAHVVSTIVDELDRRGIKYTLHEATAVLSGPRP